jgi:two-component system, chemotaxis family, response regulator Rcp1
LVVDDSASDVYLFKTALREHCQQHEIHSVADGDAALDFLRRTGHHADAPAVELVVLDINMPKRTGHEVLQEIKGDPQLKAIPVVMLTSSTNHDDITRAYGAHVNCYVQKPTTWESWGEVVHAIEQFWCGLVRLPH